MPFPCRARHVGQQLREGGPDAVLAAQHPGGRDEHGIVGVIGHDLVQVAGAERISFGVRPPLLTVRSSPLG
jgi:hypothetical protein